jgi:hypothetical protein
MEKDENEKEDKVKTKRSKKTKSTIDNDDAKLKKMSKYTNIESNLIIGYLAIQDWDFEREKQLAKIEKQLKDSTNKPESIEDYDRLIAGSPNSSDLWLRYDNLQLI